MSLSTPKEDGRKHPSSTWAHQDALVLTVKHILNDGADQSSFDKFIELGTADARASYKALCGCITHYLLQRARQKQRLTLLRLLSRLVEKTCAALGPSNVFVERVKQDVVRCVARACRGAPADELLAVSSIVDGWAALTVFPGEVLQSCYAAIEQRGEVPELSSPGSRDEATLSHHQAPAAEPKRKGWGSELSLFAPPIPPPPSNPTPPDGEKIAPAAAMAHTPPIADIAAAAPAAAMPVEPPLRSPVQLQERVPTPGRGGDPYALCK